MAIPCQGHLPRRSCCGFGASRFLWKRKIHGTSCDTTSHVDDQQQQAPSEKRPARILLEGRYRKFVRDLPQTIFYCPSCKGRKGGCERCDGYGKLTKDSVQEILARKILPAYKARRGKFHGAGREDVDVRMLGGGRPFVFEIQKPRNLDVDEEELLAAIHDYGAGRIQVTKLVAVPRRRIAELKETHSDKIYRVLVELLEIAPDSADPFEIGQTLVGRHWEVCQRTPKRVVHRRADKERIRRVEVLGVDRCRGFLEIEIRCQHGTYVKEWISGDDGRSQPALSELLGCTARCVALDVLEILGPFPDSAPGLAPLFEGSLSWPLPQALSPDRWNLESISEIARRV